MDVAAFLADLEALEVGEVFARYRVVLEPDGARLKVCKEPLVSLGTLEHSAWEQEHNYGSTLVRLGFCPEERVLFRHKRSVYATRTSACRYREDVSNQYEALGPAGLAGLRPQPTCWQLADSFALALRRDLGWLRRVGANFHGYRNAQALHQALQAESEECRCFCVARDLEQQGPGISRADFLLRTHPGPTFGFSE